MRHWPVAMVGIIAVCALASCAPPPPPPPPPTIVNITLTAAPNDNPGPDGQPAPLAMRVYQLASSAGFAGAEFFPLYSADATTLGQDLVKRDDALLAPGQTVKRTLTPRDDVHAIGVFAGYREFNSTPWRAFTDIVPHRTTDITVSAGPGGLTLKSVTEPPPPPPKPGS